MIGNFLCKETEKIFYGSGTKKLFYELQNRIRMKLRWLNRAEFLQDLRQPPGNRLESLKGNRKGQYSIRVNDQWRICFKWKEGQVLDVEVVDYH